MKSPRLRSCPLWPVSGSRWLDPDQCWWWGTDRPMQSPAWDPLRVGAQHPASSTGKVKECWKSVPACFYSAFAVWLVPENSNALGRLGCIQNRTCGLQGSTGGRGQLNHGAPAALAACWGCAQDTGWVTVSQASLLLGRQNQEPLSG